MGIANSIAAIEAGTRTCCRENLDLLAAYEGSALLANTLRDPSVLSEASGRLDAWIDAQ